jgi:hypothetical protein
VSRRILHLVAAAVLIVATLTPLANCFDTWDKGQPPVNDTELKVTVLFIGAGFILVLPKLVRRFLITAVCLQTARPSSFGVARLCAHWARPEPSASPPCIPLRI